MLEWIIQTLIAMIQSGIAALVDYLSFHVLLCLIPAFFIAGAMAVFIPQEAVMKYLGKESKKIVAYPMAAVAGFLLAVCSCTVLPLFAGIWKKGAGIGPAVTFLFSAPAVNLLALTYTGVLIGLDIAIARAILALGFAIGIGLLMDLIYPIKEEQNSQTIDSDSESSLESSSLKKSFTPVNLLNTILVILFVITGLFLAVFNQELLISLGISDPALLQTLIWILGLFSLLVLSWTLKYHILGLFLWLVYVLFTGTSQISYFNDPLLDMLSKAFLTTIVAIGTTIYVFRNIPAEQRRAWMSETYFFVKMIFPYIIIGVFLAGMVRILIPPQLVQGLVGRNTVLANLIGVLFGVLMYFPTLMEVPIAKMFLELGMSRGVLLAYLLADPELSIQSILVTRKFLGDKKNLTYVILVIISSVLAGLIFGLTVVGEPIGLW
ncbi:MAG: permease [Candidatus Hermodarchaeota archaeon]